jgi:hypothetical protein
MHILRAAVLAALLLVPAMAGAAEGQPDMKLNQCVRTEITAITTRLYGTPKSGVGIDYANGATQVTYQDEKPNPRMMLSRLGDPVILCLVKLDTTCPPNDDRGRVYKTNNLRTKKTWEVQASGHWCGGA